MKTSALLYSVLALTATVLSAPSPSHAGVAQGDAVLVARQLVVNNQYKGTGFAVVDTRGREAYLMPPEEGVDRDPGSWSPAGTNIVFEVSRDDGLSRSHLWVMDRQGGGVRRITQGIGLRYQPVWGPGGIAYVENFNCLHVVGGQGQNHRRLFCLPEDGLIVRLQWSPDGKSVLFFGENEIGGGLEPPTDQSIYRVNVRTGLATRIFLRRLNGPSSSRLYLSPDAAWAVDINYDRAERFSLIELATGAESGLGIDGRSPVWSPDSQRLAFTGPFGVLYVMDAATRPSERRLRRLTSNPQDITFVPVAWSRDGTCLLANRLHYVGTGENAYTVSDPVIFNLVTGERTRLPQGAAVEHGWFQHE